MIRLIVAADEPALFFGSIDGAARYLEAIDVEDGVYTAAYGPQGQCYRLTADKGRVVIVPDTRPDDPQALKSLLLHFLAAAKIKTTGAEDLPDLLAQCERYITR